MPIPFPKVQVYDALIEAGPSGISMAEMSARLYPGAEASVARDRLRAVLLRMEETLQDGEYIVRRGQGAEGHFWLRRHHVPAVTITLAVRARFYGNLQPRYGR